MMTITHNEVRRHPRWREEPSTPVPKVTPLPGARLLGIAVALIVVATVAILLLKGFVLTAIRK